MNKTPEMSLAACVGLDWADRRHVICLRAVDREETESIQLEQKPDALHEWIARLRARFGPAAGIAGDRKCFRGHR